MGEDPDSTQPIY